MKKILILIVLIAIAIFELLFPEQSFEKSKKILLNEIYHDNKVTFYCSNPYKIVQDGDSQRAVITQNKKYYSPRNATTKAGNENERAKRVEWEHIMPAHNFGQHLPCWKQGGRKECAKDSTFKQMEADMHNLVPAIGEVNGDRSNYRFGVNKPKKGQYGNCEFEVDFKAKRAHPKDSIRGDIARAYLYMSDKYKINLSDAERKLMLSWDKLDPVDEWERLKNERVRATQGNSNPYIGD